ncbi:hypothetical protein HNQ91_001965 [Filimonas zeae]|uniref:SWIM-type domain-containing protein n=1 Tax=Filimonas zeae TaxID=1737353 RepID=A0A917IVR9_9BACT|nr:SWIM zinc finger family protein [Filimonas zeae]MDR6338914.1 hypothetical protein [Filimonas zeae]GGH65995.1 hypothetical protein GCM10011379_19690 [Filimonas zeae]
MQLTEEQVLALAPDDASRKAGKDLASPNKWLTKATGPQALWGECQGSGSKPYQTQVDLAGMAFKCSCPSRKFPCKHGVGLLILYACNAASFTPAEPPAWVNEWLAKRSEKEEKKADKKDKPVDEAAQAKRLQAREQGVEDGLAELLLWIKDIVRNGLIGVPEKDPAFFSNMARRMVDAKATGLAALVKTAGNTNFYAEGWQSGFMDLLVRMYLLITGFTHRAQLPAALQEDVRSLIGFTQSQDELKAQTGITDTWLVLGKQTTEEDNLTVERNWLYGIQTQRSALVLQFSVMGQGFTYNLLPGTAIQAELVYYPSTQPLRAIIKQQQGTGQAPVPAMLNGWQQVAEIEATLHSTLPFSSERPYILQQLTPVQYQGRWCLADQQQHIMPVTPGFAGIWQLLSVSGGLPLDMAVVGKEHAFEPLGIWSNGQYIGLYH